MQVNDSERHAPEGMANRSLPSRGSGTRSDDMDNGRSFLRQAAAGVYHGARHLWQRRGIPRALHSLNAAWSALRAELGCDDDAMILRCKDRLETAFPWSWGDREAAVTEFRRQFDPAAAGRIQADAELVCAHVFDFLGSGPRSAGDPIQWLEDLKTGTRWPLWPMGEVPIIRKPGSDIVRVWELSRFQWGPTLGQAYWLTEDERYPHEFAREVEDWTRRNPPGFGPNWISSQDAALRAVNWIAALGFMGGSPRLERNDWRRMLAWLYTHGLWIEKHLDLNHMGAVRTTGTHYLSGLLGLLYLGLLFHGSRASERWLQLGTAELAFEMSHEVLADGADYESSIACYHRFATEHFLNAGLLFLLNRLPVPAGYLQRLEKMFDFAAAYTRPDGTVPQIGDNGDGRVMILSNFYGWPRNDHRFLAGIGGELFDRSDLRDLGRAFGEEAFWLLRRARSRGDLPLESRSTFRCDPPRSAAFGDSGFYFMRHGRAFLAISANPVGMNGKGNHKHNDVFSIDLFCGDTAFIVDPGSYVYTSDRTQRHLFRSTAYHNTLAANDCEQNVIRPDLPWRVQEQAHPAVTCWESDEDHDAFCGTHRGYGRCREGLVVSRSITFDKQHRRWILEDSIAPVGTPSGPFEIAICFHLGAVQPEVTAGKPVLPAGDAAMAETTVQLRSQSNDRLAIHSVAGNGLTLQTQTGWVSERYGERRAAPVLVFSGRFLPPRNWTFILQAT